MLAIIRYFSRKTTQFKKMGSAGSFVHSPAYRSIMGRSQGLPGPKRRVLVVDDDPAVRELLTVFLEERDFEVRTAPDGPAGVAAFNVEPFDLILVDFQMPDMTGLEMATEVRRTDPQVPIALITGIAGTLEAEAVAQAGITRTLPKPFDLNELANWLQSLFPPPSPPGG
jgi:DNA-binding response OmpR family regulator